MSMLEEEKKILAARKVGVVEDEGIAEDEEQQMMEDEEERSKPINLDALSVQSPYQYIIWEAYDERTLRSIPYPQEEITILDKEYMCKISSSRPTGAENGCIPADIFSG